MRKITLLSLVLLISAPASAQLSGSFTINPLFPNGGGNYITLASAVADLITQGVSGPVEFLIFDDNGPYTETNPFVTSNVSWAPSTAVLVLGSWTGASAANRVVFRAAPGELPVFDATNQAMGVFWNGADYVTLEGIEIRGALYDAVSLYSEAQHGQVVEPIIRGCNLHDCGSCGVVIYGNSPNPLNTLVENCFLWNLQTTSAGGFGTTARFGYISSRRQIGTRVNHNTFFVSSSAGSAFCVMGANPGGSADNPWAEIRSNIIVKTSNANRPIYVWPNLGTLSGIPVSSEDNCYDDSSTGNFAISGGTVVIDLASWRTTTSLDLRSFSANPQLAAPLVGDLHLQPGSPCIDAAWPWPIATYDYDGQHRNGIPDIGADEVLGNVAQASIIGVGYTTGGGAAPALGTLLTPTLGNTAFSLDLSGALPGSVTLLYAAFQVSNPALNGLDDLPNYYLDLDSSLILISAGHSPVGPTLTDINGAANYPIPIPSTPELAGFEMAFQAAVYTASVPVSVSNAVLISMN